MRVLVVPGPRRPPPDKGYPAFWITAHAKRAPALPVG